MSFPTPSSSGDYYRRGRREQAVGGELPKRWAVLREKTFDVAHELRSRDAAFAWASGATNSLQRYYVFDRRTGHFFDPISRKRVHFDAE